MDTIQRRVEIFYSYAHEDEHLLDALRRQLAQFERQGNIRQWHDRVIPPGTQWRGHIDQHLEDADLILLCVSPHFLESDFCEAEMTAALRRHGSGLAKVVPIILRPCPWESAPCGTLQVLPKDGRPVTSWPDLDQACLDVAAGIMRVVQEIRGTPPTAAGGAPLLEDPSETTRSEQPRHVNRAKRAAGLDDLIHGERSLRPSEPRAENPAGRATTGRDTRNDELREPPSRPPSRPTSLATLVAGVVVVLGFVGLLQWRGCNFDIQRPVIEANWNMGAPGLTSGYRRFQCPPADEPLTGTIYGTDTYTLDSPVCLAALHSGLITKAGGFVKIENPGKMARFVGTLRNGVKSLDRGSEDAAYVFRVPPE